MTRWFPIFPGATLPAAPAAVGGQITATKTVPVWNETVLANGISKTKLEVASFAYALNLLSEITVATNTILNAGRSLPAVTIALTAATPGVRSGASVAVPSAATALAAVSPDVSSGASVSVPAIGVALAALEVENAGPPRLVIQVASLNSNLSALTPDVAGGASVQGPSVNIVQSSPALLVNPPVPDPYFSNVSLLLHMNGSNGSTVFTDSSSNTLTVTAYGNAQISTTQSKFGGASGYFDGSGSTKIQSASSSTLTLPGDFTIEFWIYRTVETTTVFELGSYSDGILFRVNRFSDDLYINGSAPNGGPNTGAYITLNNWTHVALVRVDSIFKWYFNGLNKQISSLLTSWTRSGTLNSTGSPLKIGAANDEPFTGHIDDFRITKGVARYSSDFTPPSAPFPDS